MDVNECTDTQLWVCVCWSEEWGLTYVSSTACLDRLDSTGLSAGTWVSTEQLWCTLPTFPRKHTASRTHSYFHNSPLTHTSSLFLFISLAFAPSTRWLTHLLPLSFPHSAPPPPSPAPSVLCSSRGEDPSSVRTRDPRFPPTHSAHTDDLFLSCNDCVHLCASVSRRACICVRVCSHFKATFASSSWCLCTCSCVCAFVYASA